MIVQNKEYVRYTALFKPEERETADVKAILDSKGKYSKYVENVLPEIGTLNVEPCRNLIRRIFIENIIKAKGIEKVNRIIGGVIMPTPVAVLKAARLLVEGCGGEKGLGELMVVDLGGATTDVHSIAVGEPTESGIITYGVMKSNKPYQMKKTKNTNLEEKEVVLVK